TSTKGLTDLIAPHVSLGAHLVKTRRSLTAEGRGRSVRIARCASVQETDHTEVTGLTKRRLLRQVRIGVICRTLHSVALVLRLAGFLTHRAFFALMALTGAAFFVVGVLGDDVFRLLFLLTLSGRVQVLLNEKE